MSEEKWKCPKCGAENTMDDNFCGECGSKKPAVGIGAATKQVSDQSKNVTKEENNDAIPKDKAKHSNKVKIIGIISVCCLIVFFVEVYAVQKAWQTKAKKETTQESAAEYENKIKPVYSMYLDEKSPTVEKLNSYITQLNKLLKLEELRYDENRDKIKSILEEIEAKKVDAEKKAANAAKKRRLSWSKRSSDKMTWPEAIDYCQNLNEGGYTDWRLPNIDELRTIIKNCPKTETGGQCKVSRKKGCLSWERCGNGYKEGSCYCESLNNNGGYYSKLGDNDNVRLWSSSIISDKTGSAWYVHFYSGGVYGYDKDNANNINVRCVR